MEDVDPTPQLDTKHGEEEAAKPLFSKEEFIWFQQTVEAAEGTGPSIGLESWYMYYHIMSYDLTLFILVHAMDHGIFDISCS